MKDCIFCQIVLGDIPCSKLYETKDVLAFLDITPVMKGHSLVIPKKHVVNILDLPESLAADVQKVLKKVGKGLINGLKADGFNLGMNNFEAAGQLVMHAHYHLIPRFAGDGLKLWPQNPYDSKDEMQDVGRRIQSGMSSA